MSANEGRVPSWTKGGSELIYIESRRWMAVEVSTVGDAFRAGKPELLFEGDFGGFGPWSYYDVSADGERFFLFPPSKQESDDTLVTFVFDFFDEVRRLTGE